MKVEESIRKATEEGDERSRWPYIDPATGEIVPGVEIIEKVSVSVKVEQ